jgi:hypothetical protein
MLRELEKRVWWPSMWVDINKHFNVCGICTPLTHVTRRPGLSLLMTVRFQKVVMDHWILPAHMAKATGIAANATMADMSATTVVGKPVKSTNGQEAAMALISA